MVEIIYLQPGTRLPEMPTEGPWLAVEANDDGRFYGTGCGWKPSGEEVFYISAAESDTTFEAAIAAATNWARERGVPRIWVQTTPG
jgi:hypothetical protein